MLINLLVKGDHLAGLAEGAYQNVLPREVTRPIDLPAMTLFTIELYFERHVAVREGVLQTPLGTRDCTRVLELAGSVIAANVGLEPEGGLDRLYTVPFSNSRSIATTFAVVGPEFVALRPDEGVLYRRSSSVF